MSHDRSYRQPVGPDEHSVCVFVCVSHGRLYRQLVGPDGGREVFKQQMIRGGYLGHMTQEGQRRQEDHI